MACYRALSSSLALVAGVSVDRSEVGEGVVVACFDVVYLIGSGLVADVADSLVSLQYLGPAFGPVGGKALRTRRAGPASAHTLR